jgi:hypothetical protein
MRSLPKFGVRSSLALLISFVLLAGWWFIASNYDYDALAGTYVFHGDGVTSTLVLRKDTTFHQTNVAHGVKTQADGQWRRIGEGGVNFSSEFLRVPGAKDYLEELPGQGDGGPEDHQFFGDFSKFLGLYPSLELRGGPVFHKRPFT